VCWAVLASRSGGAGVFVEHKARAAGYSCVQTPTPAPCNMTSVRRLFLEFVLCLFIDVGEKKKKRRGCHAGRNEKLRLGAVPG
jgi:hypothetical protein